MQTKTIMIIDVPAGRKAVILHVPFDLNLKDGTELVLKDYIPADAYSLVTHDLLFTPKEGDEIQFMLFKESVHDGYFKNSHKVALASLCKVKMPPQIALHFMGNKNISFMEVFSVRIVA